jgi:hypothetical protein
MEAAAAAMMAFNLLEPHAAWPPGGRRDALPRKILAPAGLVKNRPRPPVMSIWWADSITIPKTPFSPLANWAGLAIPAAIKEMPAS